MNKHDTHTNLQDKISEIRSRVNDGNPLESLIKELALMQGQFDELATEVRILRGERRLRDILLPEVRAAYKGLDIVKIDAGQPLSEDQGFYSLEYDQQGQAFRWTGPRPIFYFDLHLDRSSPLRMRVVLANGFGARARALRAFCDGAEIPLEKTETPSRTQYSAVLFPREAHGLTRIAFLPTEMFRPGALPGHEDQRVLGVVFREIQVDPTSEQDAQQYLKHCDSRTQLLLSTVSTTGDSTDIPLPPPPVLSGVQS